MISVSEVFKNLMISNVRPKCEPKIRIYGEDASGDVIELIWTAGNIKDLKYKFEIDVVGRTLPQIELQWTEIYTGKLNAESYPEKYQNIAKYMAVELSFEQQLGKYSGWGDIFNSNSTWDSLYNTNSTWSNVFLDNGTQRSEILYAPKLYLNARPSIKNNIITWTAKDLLFFMNGEVLKSFSISLSSEETSIPYVNPIAYLILNERGSYTKSKNIFDAMTNTCNDVLNMNLGNLSKGIIFDSKTKDALLNYASLKNLHWSFSKEKATLNNYNISDPIFIFTGNIMKEYPEVTNGTDISTYSWKAHIAEPGNKYQKQGADREVYPGIVVREWLFDKYGVVDSFGLQEINRCITHIYPDTPEEIEVTAINLNAYNYTQNTGKQGEEFVEDNPVCPYRNTDNEITKRIDFLKGYFNKNCCSLSFTGLPNLSIEPGDVISVETNLFDGDNRIYKDAIVVGIEATFNGAWNEKFKVHEVA